MGRDMMCERKMLGIGLAGYVFYFFIVRATNFHILDLGFSQIL